MDAVKAFNLELSGLYEVKPPISKAKMTSITKGAIKGIKFYKHVVQSVEKFILKCKSEYKVPGLYVIDSIVRQSRHQFGAERDVFAPRFAKNMQQTFVNLFSCPEEEKSKVIRVLNLWQKNQVFPPEVIQPLFDLADPNHPIYKEQSIIQSNGMGNQSGGALVKGSPALHKSPAKGSSQVSHADLHSGVVNTQLHKTLHKHGADGKLEGAVRFDRKLLDFDYDDEEDEDHNVNPSPKPPPHNPSNAFDTVGSLLSNPEVLRQLQTLQQSMSQSQQYQEIDIEKLRKLQEMKQQEEEFDKHLAQTVPNLPFAAECELKPPPMTHAPQPLQPYYMTGIQDLGIPPPGYKPVHPMFEMPLIQEGRMLEPEMQSRGPPPIEIPEVEVINLDQTDSRSPSPVDERYANRRRRSKSRERSRDRLRGKDRDRRSKRSRSRSRSRERRRPRSRSRERERDRDRDRDREREKDKERDKERDRDKEKERRKRGLPPIKKDHLCVCSTTLWVGHLSKLVQQEELSDTFGEYGGVTSIDLIPPRGCAFIVMHRRQDAARCLEKLKNHKLQSKAITLAWAPGKGLKGKDLKDYWEVDLGASYIPWSKVKPGIDIELLEDGGMIDEDSMPAWLKAKVTEAAAIVVSPPNMPLMPNMGGPIPSLANIDTSQPPPMPGPPMTGPPMPGPQMLQPPPALSLPMVNPFQINLSMSLPPGMMRNVPIGVPPPNMAPPTMMPNQLIGFPPGPGPGLLPPPMSMPPHNKPPPMNKPMPPFSIMQPPPLFLHDDTMDVEMEDVDRSSKPPPLSDQLLASLSHNADELNLSAAVSRLNAVSGHRSDDNDTEPYNERPGRDGGDRRDGGDKYSYDKNQERFDNRDRREGRRERGNRWGDKDHNEYDDRIGNGDQNLSSRLREIAHADAYLSRDVPLGQNIEPVNFHEPPPDRPSLLDGVVFAPRFNSDETIEQNDDINAFINPEPPSNDFLQGGEENQFSNLDNDNWRSNPRDGWENNPRGDSWDQNDRLGFERPPRHNGPPTGKFDYNRDDSHRQPHISVRNEIFLKEDRFLNNDNDFNKEHNTFAMGPPEFGSRGNSLLGPGPVDPGYGVDAEHAEQGGFEQGLPMFGGPEIDGSMHGMPEHGHSAGPFPPQFGGPDRGRLGFGGHEQRRRGFDGPDRETQGFDGPDRGGRGFDGPDRGGRGFDGPGRGGGRGFDGPGRGGRRFDGPGRGGRGFDGPDRRGHGFDGPDHGGHGFDGPDGGPPRGFGGSDNRHGFGRPDRGGRGASFGGPRQDNWGPRNMRGDNFRQRGRGGFNVRGPQGRGPRNFGPRWNDGDRNFQPRFDGPPDYFKGPKFDERPRRGFDESHPPRHRRDDRRSHRRDFEDDRRSREEDRHQQDEERHPRDKDRNSRDEERHPREERQPREERHPREEERQEERPPHEEEHNPREGERRPREEECNPREEERNPREKRSRWGNSPRESYFDESKSENMPNEEMAGELNTDQTQGDGDSNFEAVENTFNNGENAFDAQDNTFNADDNNYKVDESNYDAGNSTPLHDERQEPESTGSMIEQVVQSEAVVTVEDQV